MAQEPAPPHQGLEKAAAAIRRAAESWEKDCRAVLQKLRDLVSARHLYRELLDSTYDACFERLDRMLQKERLIDRTERVDELVESYLDRLADAGVWVPDAEFMQRAEEIEEQALAFEESLEDVYARIDQARGHVLGELARRFSGTEGEQPEASASVTCCPGCGAPLPSPGVSPICLYCGRPMEGSPA